MIPELGYFSLIVALFLSVMSIILPTVGLFQKNDSLCQSARPLVLGQCFLIVLSLMVLSYAFFQDDFSVAYVALHSNSALPLRYKFSALWGGHEGSFLLWITLYSAWILVFMLRAQKLPLAFATRTLVILSALQCGFLLFTVLTSNPFLRLLPHFPLDGQDLNPLLQDKGLLIHPPLLYLGYSGMAVPFAMALSVLWGKEIENWAKWMRSWVLAAFAFLTLGIGLGSAWAYYELGWGGWWFWDPVENASLMPWLIALALIHNLMVADKRRIFQSLSLLLSILAFTLSLLGSFLVRSGILTSVHSFALDAKRGVFLFLLFGITVIGALGVWTWNRQHFSAHTKIEVFSRESLIGLSILLLKCAVATILLGTLFPLGVEIATGQKISVGFPYFNSVFVPLMIPVLIMAPLGPLFQWGANTFKDIRAKNQKGLLIACLGGVLFPVVYGGRFLGMVALGIGLALWIILGTFQFLLKKIEKQGLSKVSLGVWGMISAHMGAGILVLGITLVSHYQIEKEVEIALQQSLSLGGYQVTFKAIHPLEGPNYIGYQADFEIQHQGRILTHLYPEKRIFILQKNTMTETALYTNLWSDIYIALGERQDKGQWSARIYYKPGVRGIWWGALGMALGGFLAALGRRLKKGSI